MGWKTLAPGLRGKAAVLLTADSLCLTENCQSSNEIGLGIDMRYDPVIRAVLQGEAAIIIVDVQLYSGLTPNVTDSYLVYVLKMEYVYKINIFGLKMMVKSGLEKIFLKFLHAQSLFQKIFFTS